MCIAFPCDTTEEDGGVPRNRRKEVSFIKMSPELKSFTEELHEAY
jgi:hypothetical protein